MLKSNGEAGNLEPVEARGAETTGINESAWRKLAGASEAHDLTAAYAADKERDRKREDSRS